MEGAYSAYSYRRYKKPKRFFAFFMVVLTLGSGFFVANLMFGFVDFGGVDVKKSDIVVVPALTFYVTETDSVESKSTAMRMALDVKERGGASYLVKKGTNWAVVDGITDKNDKYAPVVAYSAPSAEIRLVDLEHRALIETLVGTFGVTFATLCDYMEKFEAHKMVADEIIGVSCLAYNNLVDLVGEFEILRSEGAWSSDYARLYSALCSQMFGLAVIWLEGRTENFAHVLKNAMAWVAFAYLD